MALDTLAMVKIWEKLEIPVTGIKSLGCNLRTPHVVIISPIILPLSCSLKFLGLVVELYAELY